MLTATHRKHIEKSVKGSKRRENQDNYLIIENDNYDLYFVFDGVGGAANGKMATEIAKRFIRKNHSSFFHSAKMALDELMFETNSFLVKQNIDGLKTTFCSVCFSKSTDLSMQYSSLGDSRVYVMNRQYIEQITKDDKPNFSQNVITKCLGMVELSKNDFYLGERLLNREDSILLCTDGFYHLMESDRLSFFNFFNMQLLAAIKNNVHDLIKGTNIDDATYVLIKQ